MSLARRSVWARAFVVLTALLAIALATITLGLAVRFPCWRYSNAAWCGHFCDDDPCACPDRARYQDPYGSGPGCVP